MQEKMITNIQPVESQPQRYDPVSRAFHWITAIVVGIAFVLGPEGFGRLMHQGVDPASRSDIVWHETLGLFVFALTACRLIWIALRPSVPQSAMVHWMYVASKAVHLALWALLLLLPVTALLALGSESHALTLLGGYRLNEMPLILNSPIARLADWGDVHKFLGDAVIAIAGGHALAAIYHHVALKDGVLLTMLPERQKR